MAPAHREHNCIHEHLGEPVEPRRRTRQLYEAGEGGPPPEKSGPDEGDGDASGMQPLRIVINTDALRSDPGYTCFRVGEFVNGQPCRQEQVLTPVKRSTLEESLMPRAAAFFSKALSVKRVVGNLRLGSFRCGFSGGVAVPREYATTGVEGADIVFFVTARPIAAQTGSDTIAFSGHCEVDQFGRPIAAHFNWSPVHLDVPNSDFESTYLLRVALHEMTHALVFSPGLFDQFHRQPATAFLPAVGACSGGRTRAIVTPRALRVARNHFDCPKLEGAPLEDGGGAGTGGAHWEMRLFRDEYMTGAAP
ncbi:hypothetical protein EMIHUDRAFT_454065 [Emiliania huxleyi CCMP1516]|uniref:Leishmanolysin n=2 Tax=Emiliania huxleyi TaxID=2903 RepID=A0A0D3KYY9_EMIH1|nr:hypothetical protein EMIHUDRAFT_454065 [Emiliania huxleyi CCMP1516]EOD40974.1 hypothetical protein EMIHUDRAFT_454065 [Emiliania huxleyi CCMP1516]|eukprot:XP_005793403.1 hypothetical protein EMIHUDRAFT_454065 [Emiliania huxleyi CCMP1516]